MYSNPATRPLFRLLAPLAFGAIAYLLVLLAFDTHSRVLENFFNEELLVCIGMSYAVLEANRLLAVSFSKVRRDFWIKSALKLVLALLFTAAITSGLLILYFRYRLDMHYILSFYTELKVFNGIFLFIALLYQSYFLGFVWLHYQYQQKFSVEEEKSRELEQQIYQFCYTIHPDFLFSGMEHIILKIREGQTEAADAGISLLAELYHYFLRRQEELVPLVDELVVIEKLHQLLSHSGKWLELKKDIQNPESMVVPGSLVRLTEAIAQSQLSSFAAPLVISLKQQQQELIISFKPNFSLVHQHVLDNILKALHQQYAWLTGKILYWTPVLQPSTSVPVPAIAELIQEYSTPEQTIITELTGASSEYYQISIPTLNLQPHESNHH